MSAAGLVAASLAALVGLAGCDAGAGVKKGPPALARFLVRGPDGGKPRDLLAQAPDGGAGTVPQASTLLAVFDRLIDPDRIEQASDGGFVGRDGAVTIAWNNAPGGARPVGVAAFYNPAGTLDTEPPGPGLAIRGDDARVVFPSGASLSVDLVRSFIVSKAGEPLVGPASVAFQTDPLAATIGVPMAGVTVRPGFEVRVSFTSRVDPAAVEAAVSVTVGGSVVPIAIAMPTPSELVLTRTGGWEPGTEYVVTVAAEATDVYGVKLGVDVINRFTTAGPSPDGGADAPDAPDGGGG